MAIKFLAVRWLQAVPGCYFALKLSTGLHLLWQQRSETAKINNHDRDSLAGGEKFSAG